LPRLTWAEYPEDEYVVWPDAVAHPITFDAELAPATPIRWMALGIIREAPDRHEDVLHTPSCDRAGSGLGVP
jgi:hypothetical protein